jgi:hypothetical protein
VIRQECMVGSKSASRGSAATSSRTTNRRLLLLILSGLCQHAFGATPVSFRTGLAVHILFEGVLDDNLSVAEILTLHAVNGGIRGGKIVVLNETKALALLGVIHIARNRRRSNQGAKGTKGIVEQLFVDRVRVQVAQKQIRTHILVGIAAVGSSVEGTLGHAQGSSVQFHHVQDGHAVIRILHGHVFNKAVPVVHTRQLVFGHVD